MADESSLLINLARLVVHASQRHTSHYYQRFRYPQRVRKLHGPRETHRGGKRHTDGEEDWTVALEGGYREYGLQPVWTSWGGYI